MTSQPPNPAAHLTWPQYLALAGCGLVVVFWLLRPGSSESLSGVTLFGFWGLHIFAALGLLQGAQMLLMRWPRIAALRSWVQLGLSGLLGAVAFTPVAAGLDVLFGVAGQTDDGEEQGIALLIGEFAALAPLVLVIWFGLNATRLVRLVPHATAPAPDTATPAFWGRVPKEIGRDLVALSAELHYLRVYTAQGDALILYPFGRAVAELAASEAGLQVHRSHWIAQAHVQAVSRRGQGAVARMDTGLEVPISRSFRPAAQKLLQSIA